MNDRTPPRSRPKYHYFYGSTDDTPSIGSPGKETDSLFGESLVPTDTEGDDTPTNSAQDLQHLMVTNGSNDLLPPMPGSGASSPYLIRKDMPARGRSKSWFARSCESHPGGHFTRVFLIMILAVSMFTLAIILSPYDLGGAMGGTADGSSGATRSFQYIPFPIVERIDYNDPASSIINLELFEPTMFYQGTRDRSHRGTGDAIDPMLKVPFPTGAFWTNLVLKQTTDDDFSYPAVVYPYAYKWSDESLKASYPALHRSVDKTSIRDTFIPDITFGTNESVVKRHITHFDPLSVTTRFYTDSGGYWESYLVQGSPYITIKYDHATPVIKALSIFKNFVCPLDSDGKYNDGNVTLDENGPDRGLSWGVCASSDSSPLADKSINGRTLTLHGVQFLLQTAEDLTWILFASEPIALSFDTITKTTVTASQKFTGVLRLALVPPSKAKRPDRNSSSNPSVPVSTSTGFRRLVYHSRVYPTGGSVAWDFKAGSPQPSLSTSLKKAITDATLGFSSKPPENNVGTIQFVFDTSAMTDNSNSRPNSLHDDLLMLSLPHHAQMLRNAVMLTHSKFDLSYRCIKGSMTPVVGSTWSYDEILTTVGFDDFDQTAYVKNLDTKVRATIEEQIPLDINRVLPTLDENVYGFGKQVARLAQLAHIASIMEMPVTSVRNKTASNAGIPSKSLSSIAAQQLESFLEKFFKEEVADSLLFDAKFGGVVTRDGLLDPEADFGNGRYNDHHFHYGYILYACAIMGRLNSTFVDEYGSYADALLFDVAHSSNGNSIKADGVFFPLARHMSWFDGHSFASGLFPYANGKSQESSSEAVNSYYGAYLWSMVREGQDDSVSELSDFARLLLAMEIRGARTYWHMEPPAPPNATALLTVPVYNPIFAQNYMVGNLGMLDAVCSTWFGTASLYVHMINFLPVTAITSELFSRSYVKEEFKNVLGPLLAGVEMAWRGYVISDQAIVDPNSAWTEALKLVSYQLDSATSKSQILYWISTRNGFNVTSLSVDDSSTTPKTSDDADSTSDTSSSDCENHNGCASAGLTGLCCPTSEGTMLGCCTE